LQVKKSNRFKSEIKQIVKFIGESNPKNAERFYYALMDHLDSLVDHPRKGRVLTSETSGKRVGEHSEGATEMIRKARR